MTLTKINKAGLDEIALDHVFTIGASGSSAYTFQGEGLNGTVNNPTLYLTRGKTYRFENGSGGHPIRIQSTSGASGTAYNTGVTNNAGSGTVIVEVQHDAPDVLYYQCTSHAAMNGILYITGALADGGVTTAKIADDAVTDAKLANSINSAIAANTAKTTNATHTGDVTGSTSLTIANGAVTSAKIADGAIVNADINSSAAIAGSKIDTSTFTAPITITSATPAINFVESDANPDFRISNSGGVLRVEDITGGYATKLAVNTDGHVDIFGNLDVGAGLDVSGTITGTGHVNIASGYSYQWGDSHERIEQSDGKIEFFTNNGEQMTLSGGNLGINETSPDRKLHVKSGVNNNDGAFRVESSTGNIMDMGTDHTGHFINCVNADPFRVKFAGSEKIRFQNGGGISFNGDTAAANALDDYEEGTFTLSVANGGFSSISGTGKYTKIGRVCFFSGDFSLNGSGNSSVLRMSGLPFNNTGHWTSCSGYFQTYYNEGTQQASFAVVGNMNEFRVVEYGNEMAGNSVGAGYMNIAGLYHVA